MDKNEEKNESENNNKDIVQINVDKNDTDTPNETIDRTTNVNDDNTEKEKNSYYNINDDNSSNSDNRRNQDN